MEIKVKSVDGCYRKLILVSRNVICKNLEYDDFVKYIKEDFDKAISIYNHFYNEIERLQKIEEYNAKALEHITLEAEQKYKRESSKQKFINKKLEELSKSTNSFFKESELFFDFDPSQETKQGIPSCNIINKDSFSGNRTMVTCFENLKNEKWFDNAIGWEFVYEAPINSYRNCFRPTINLILPENIENERKELIDKLKNSINKFYANCKYFGD